jgi:hypothetical protein
MALPPRVLAECQRILDGEARRLLAERLERERIERESTAGNRADPRTEAS